jgi:transposase
LKESRFSGGRERGVSQKEIAKRVNASEGTITYTLRNYNEEDYSPGFHLSGRKKKLSNEEMKMLQKKLIIIERCLEANWIVLLKR